MSATDKHTRAPRTKNTALRKLTPTALLPGGSVLRRISAEDMQWLRRRIVEPLECVYHSSFARPNAQKRCLEDIEELLKATATHMRRIGKSARQGRPRRARSLTAAEERELFLRFNYARHRVMQVLRSHAGRRLTAEGVRELLRWDRLAQRVRDRIVDANLGLVPTMVERSRITGVDFGELISEGQYALLRSVDKFDCARGFKFSTYSCRAILTSITRAVALMARHRSRFPTEYDPQLQKSDDLETRRASVEEECVDELQQVLAQNSADLTLAERRVLSERFGIPVDSNPRRSSEPKTLRQVADVFGVTKERVRQIQNKALGKLRLVLDEKIFVS